MNSFTDINSYCLNSKKAEVCSFLRTKEYGGEFSAVLCSALSMTDSKKSASLLELAALSGQLQECQKLKKKEFDDPENTVFCTKIMLPAFCSELNVCTELRKKKIFKDNSEVKKKKHKNKKGSKRLDFNLFNN
ncbi:MAG: hypothetical protein MR571_01455 [Succinatimonas sp.]|nr:hypothetical protein [Succinatimonas sp.]